MRNHNVDGKGNSIDDWNTVIYSIGNNIQPKQEQGIYRMPDDEFLRVPTIELFYTGGTALDNHFQFLTQGYCDDTAPSTTEFSDETLLSIIKRQFHAKNKSLEESPKIRTAEDEQQPARDVDDFEKEKVPHEEQRPTMEVDDSDKEILPQVEQLFPMEVDDSEKERRSEEVQESGSNSPRDMTCPAVDDSDKEKLPQVEQRPAMEVDDTEKEGRSEEVQESENISPGDMVVGTEVINDSFKNREKTNLNLG